MWCTYLGMSVIIFTKDWIQVSVYERLWAPDTHTCALARGWPVDSCTVRRVCVYACVYMRVRSGVRIHLTNKCMWVTCNIFAGNLYRPFKTCFIIIIFFYIALWYCSVINCLLCMLDTVLYTGFYVLYLCIICCMCFIAFYCRRGQNWPE